MAKPTKFEFDAFLSHNSQRVADLVDREKDGGLSPEEKAELDHFMELEHILRMAKAKACQILSRAR
jgi:hypothetical protein